MRKSLIVPALLLPAGIAVLVVASIGRPTSASQNSNSPSTTNRNENRSITPPSGRSARPGQEQDFSKNTWELPDDADKTKNPVQATPESIAKGKELYFERMKGNCVFCHGETGSGNEANLPRLRRKPADISNKERMTEMTDGEIFWKVSKGITGIMPTGEERMNEEERWNVVNYVRTLAKDK
jgi:mono/diheme cytochrome c family protein